MASVKEQTINSAKWNAIERITVQGIQFVLTLLMARLLTPDDYGVIGLLTIFIALSQAFIDSGFNTALVRTKNAVEEDYSTVFYFNFAIAIVCYTILFFAAPSIAAFFNQPILVSVLRVYSISLIINSLMAVQVSMLQIRLDFKSLAKRNVVATLLSGVIGVALAFWGFGVWALVFQNLVASLVNLVFIIYICRWIPTTGFCKDSFRRLGAFGSRLLAAGLLDTIYKNLTNFAIGKFYTSTDLGFYTRGAQFAQLPNSSINGVLGTVTYPILAKIQDDDERLLSVYRKYIQMSSMSIFIVSGLMCAMAKPIILFTLSEKWTGAIVFLSLFAFSCMFDHLNTINLNLLKVKGRSDLFLRLEIIKKSISITILAIAVPFGVLAICISKLIYNQVAVFCNTYYTGKLFNYGYLAQFRDFLPYFFKTVIACVPAYILTLSSLHNIVILILGTIVSLGIYYFLLRNDENMKELLSTIKGKFFNKK